MQNVKKKNFSWENANQESPSTPSSLFFQKGIREKFLFRAPPDQTSPGNPRGLKRKERAAAPSKMQKSGLKSYYFPRRPCRSGSRSISSVFPPVTHTPSSAIHQGASAGFYAPLVRQIMLPEGNLPFPLHMLVRRFYFRVFKSVLAWWSAHAQNLVEFGLRRVGESNFLPNIPGLSHWKFWVVKLNKLFWIYIFALKMGNFVRGQRLVICLKILSSREESDAWSSGR